MVKSESELQELHLRKKLRALRAKLEWVQESDLQHRDMRNAIEYYKQEIVEIQSQLKK
jgi:hypothetical protein